MSHRMTNGILISLSQGEHTFKVTFKINNKRQIAYVNTPDAQSAKIVVRQNYRIPEGAILCVERIK